MNKGMAIALAFLFTTTVTNQCYAAGANSAYVALSSDKYITGGPVTVLSTVVSTSKTGWLYVQSDGRFYPSGATLLTSAIYIDGNKVSNDSLIDWRGTSNPQQHSYNVIGAQQVAAGTHTISLIAQATGGAAYFGSSSNLSAMLDAATSVTNVSLAADTVQLNFNTSGTSEGTPLNAHSPKIISNISTTSAPVVVFTSGRSYVNGGYGDPMWGIYLDGAEPSIASMTWTINDMWTGAELQAPMFSQGYFSVPVGSHSFSLEASEAPYSNNNVQYKIGANSRLITLTGGMSVVGKGLNSDASLYEAYRRYSYICIATNGFNSTCPTTGIETVIGHGNVVIPTGHNGVVFFSAKTRIQGDAQDAGGTVRLYLKIDGMIVGSMGIQQLHYPDSVSTRTMSASYLATGINRLSPGTHTVDVVASADGNYHNLSMVADLPVVWFD